jgi:DNA polymerase IIIc chi subunit
MSVCIFHDTDYAQKERQLFEMVEQAYKQHEKAIIFAQTQERASAIDRILWVLKQEAFIPHRIFDGTESDVAVPIGIVTTEINPLGATMLIADGHCSIEFACSFPSIHEFVDRSSAEIQESCRDRFRAYRSQQVSVEYSKK